MLKRNYWKSPEQTRSTIEPKSKKIKQLSSERKKKITRSPFYFVNIYLMVNRKLIYFYIFDTTISKRIKYGSLIKVYIERKLIFEDKEREETCLGHTRTQAKHLN